MNHPQALHLTPSNSPFFRTSSPKSPTKTWKSEESGLRLKKVIGTTTTSGNGFDCVPSTRQFAYTAGAAAVVATVGEDLSVSQRFFRARPSALGQREGAGHSLSSDLRSKTVGGLRDQSLHGSPLGASTRDWSDSPTGKSATAKDRVKAATSVALSPDGKWVAVGETGYKPRVLIFSNKTESGEMPVSILSEHTFGVHALAFSPDSRYLASLGTVNDGFLYIWAIDNRMGSANLHSSNKCTSTINAMVWVGRGVLTVGLRYIKLWKPDEDGPPTHRVSESTNGTLTPRLRASELGSSILSPKQRVLIGKNVILGDLIDTNFTTAVPLPSRRGAVICTDAGEICLLGESGNVSELASVASVGFRITAATIDSAGMLHVNGVAGLSKRYQLESLHNAPSPTTKRDRRATMSPAKMLASLETNATVAMARIDNVAIELDSKHGIRLTRCGDSTSLDAEAASYQLSAHGEAVLGVQPLHCSSMPNAAFLTFAGNGAIQIWDENGESVANLRIPLESSPDICDIANETRTLAHVRGTSLLVLGDRFGTLSILDILTGAIDTQIRSHSAEIIDIVTFERSGVQLIATASRDRMVQLFAWNGRFELLQTMDEHAAAVTGLLTVSQGERLLSCSTDRTVIVREAYQRLGHDPLSIVYVMTRTITLKSSPTSMCLGADQNELLVAAADRSISKHSVKGGQTGFAFKCSDSEGSEATAMSKILYAPSLNGNPTIIGVSSADKSVRLYTEYGLLIARDWGHTEGITDAALILSNDIDGSDSKPKLVTVAADSTIFMWDTTSQHSTAKDTTAESIVSLDSPALSKPAALAPPLRKVLSFSELSRFKREKSIEEENIVSPLAPPTASQPSSPRRVKKKPSRSSIPPTPKLEPVSRASLRRESIRKRSPSPPSPKQTHKGISRNRPPGAALRSKSSEDVLISHGVPPSISTNGFGSITSSTESVCRTLRAYRKRLAHSSTENLVPETLRELETELKLTARVLGEKSHGGRNLDEATMAKLLEQASDRILGHLDERIKERVGDELRRSRGSSTAYETILESSTVFEAPDEMAAIAGALEKTTLE